LIELIELIAGGSSLINHQIISDQINQSPTQWIANSINRQLHRRLYRQRSARSARSSTSPTTSSTIINQLYTDSNICF
jgi:hypothetical protein